MAPLLLALAPLVQSLMSNGLNLLGNAVLSKGQDVIEQKLGIKLKAEPTPAELVMLRKVEVDHEEFLVNATLKQREQELEVTKVDNQNTADARAMNKSIQESAAASRLAKNAPYILDFIVVGATLVLAFLLFLVGVPATNRDLANMAFGALVGMCMTILNFHRGTSASSHRKDDTINNLALVGNDNVTKK